MKTYTVHDLLALGPCEDYDQERISELWAGREALSAREISELDIDIDDRYWALIKLLPKKDQRLVACDIAESVLYLFEREFPEDNRPRQAIEVSRRFAHGAANQSELKAARGAAWGAAEAAWEAARGVAEAAWGVAEAARGAAWGAARGAAWGAAWEAAEAARGAVWETKMEECLQIALKYHEALS